MKKLVLLLLLPFIGFGQSVSAPDSKSFLLSTSGQDASGFVLSGFAPTATILASISLVEFPTGTTFYLSSYTNLTPASGFGMVGNKTRLVFTGTMSSINTALASLKVNTGSATGNVKLSVAATINPTGFYYNGVNGHFYKPVTTGAFYKDARAASLLTTFKGQTGYLVTITSASEDAFIQANVPQTNIWFACTDEVIDGRWVIDAGPEKGTVIKTSNPNSGNVVGQYNNWAGGEPNGYNHGEDYAVTKWNGNQWNDLANNWYNPYVIEYGTWTNPDDAAFTEFYTNSTSHTAGDVFNVKFNFNFGILDETKFSTKMFYTPQGSTTLLPVTARAYTALNALGKVDMTADSDSTKPNMVLAFAPFTSTNLTSLYDQIVTVSDVYLAFKELANGGIMGNQSGNEFTSGMQYINADVDLNGIFDEADCFRLLQHLTGDRVLIESPTLSNTMELIENPSLITKTNWYTFTNSTRSTYPVTVQSGVFSYNYTLNVSWKGDVNLSHTANASTGKLTTLSSKTVSSGIQASLVTEQIDGKVCVTVKLDPLKESVVGTQFRLDYDNTLLQFEKVQSTAKANNFGTNRGEYINFGSLVSDDTILDNTVEYRLTFKPIQTLTNTLGLTSISYTDAVSKEGAQLKITMM
jgi:hypothetical protein